MTPSCAAPPAPAPSSCCATPVPRKYTTAFRPRRLPTPAISAPTSRRKDLIATGHTVEEIRQIVGADSLGYLSIEHVTQLAIHSKCGFCTGCFTGHYPVPAPNETMDIVYDKPLSQSQTKKRL